jgi:hypothetical protein
LLRVIDEYHEQVARACAVAESQLAGFLSGGASVAITSFQLLQPRMLHDDNWEAHALLGRRAVELILTIDDLSLRLAQFDQQIRSEGTHTDSSFANATIRQHDVKEAGQPAHMQEHAIIDYAQVLDQLRAALAALIVELEEPKRTLPWHKLPLRGRRRAARVTTNQTARAHRPTPQGGSDRHSRVGGSLAVTARTASLAFARATRPRVADKTEDVSDADRLERIHLHVCDGSRHPSPLYRS